MDIKHRIHEILAAEATAIAAVAVDDSFERAITALETCSGKTVTTGMGKAGHVGRKFAALLSSTGTPAVFLHPGDAAHGDLGIIEQNDCIVAFSTSGKTIEVLEMIRHSRKLGSGMVIAITSHLDSELRQMSDVVLNMGVVEEPCPLKLTPTASIAVMSAISDALALVLMERKGFTRRDFSLRHHGGYLGSTARLEHSHDPHNAKVNADS